MLDAVRQMVVFVPSWVNLAGNVAACFNSLGFLCCLPKRNLKTVCVSKMRCVGIAMTALDMPKALLHAGMPKLIASTAFCPCFWGLNSFLLLSERPEYSSKKRFLFGESMGGAVTILLSWKEPETYTGAVLIAPMCKVSLFRTLILLLLILFCGSSALPRFFLVHSLLIWEWDGTV